MSGALLLLLLDRDRLLRCSLVDRKLDRSKGATTPTVRPSMLDPLTGALAPPNSRPSTRSPSRTLSSVDVPSVPDVSDDREMPVQTANG